MGAYKSMNRTLCAPLQKLICAPEEIFNAQDIAQKIAKLDSVQDAREKRSALCNILGTAFKQGRARIKTAFEHAPCEAKQTTAAYAYLMDCIIVTAFDFVCRKLYPNAKTSTSESLTVIVVGGYGRGEMAPHSDVDILFLTPYKITPWAENVIETMLYMLWDLRLKVGHASRSVKECLTQATRDYTIRTSLVEIRYLTGERSLFDALQCQLKSELFSKTAVDFIEAKLQERALRHQKQGGQRYMVEPNVKEGKGGLRDLQSLYWIGKYITGAKDAAQLVEDSLFTPDEYATFQRAENFQWAVRCHLHLLSGRAADQLTFDLQVDIAQRMGYHDRDGRRAVECFMQDYFRHATLVGELTRIFLTALEAAHVKKTPKLRDFLKSHPKLRSDFTLKQNALIVKDTDYFYQDGINILRLFEEGLRTGILIHPDTMRQVSAHLDVFNDGCRTSPEAIRIFCDLLLKHGNPERSLRRMNELGVLAAFIPEFEPIVAMMQFNMYHSYTVDEHTIQTISHLARIERGELIEELPIASAILKRGLNRKVIYIALLLHDIGKGREEDHSILGARIARTVTQRLGLTCDESETVEWLVRYHLLMSDMAQKRDVADPRTVRDFAKAVQTQERLDLLTVLTVCDISGVGPGVWNNWKAVLIRALYRQTRRALETGVTGLSRENMKAKAIVKLRDGLRDWPSEDVQKEIERHYPPYWQGLHITAHVVFAHMLRDFGTDEIKVDIQPDLQRDATRTCFAMVDHPGIFSRMAGALALVGANIVDARTFTTKDGYVASIYWIQDADGHPYAAERLPRLKQMIYKTLKGEIIARDAIKSKDKFKKREKPFKVPTAITFDNEGSEIYTIIEVDTRDRPGLLYDLTSTLAASNVNIFSAVVATYGVQAVDVFYVKDTFGLKYHSKAKQAFLEQKLKAAIDRGADWAHSE